MSEVAILFPERASVRGEVARAWFTRPELDRLFRLYGLMVARGEWRDYSLSDTPDMATFAVYRRAREHPIYRIDKIPKLARRQGAYQVVAATGLILKRGHDLDQVLKPLERALFKLLD